jgi:hypothetical protein
VCFKWRSKGGDKSVELEASGAGARAPPLRIQWRPTATNRELRPHVASPVVTAVASPRSSGVQQAQRVGITEGGVAGGGIAGSGSEPEHQPVR